MRIDYSLTKLLGIDIICGQSKNTMNTGKCEFYLDDVQLGFRNASGTREVLFGINVLFKKCRKQQDTSIFFCCVLSLLFHLYLNELVNEALEDTEYGAKVNLS